MLRWINTPEDLMDMEIRDKLNNLKIKFNSQYSLIYTKRKDIEGDIWPECKEAALCQIG